MEQAKIALARYKKSHQLVGQYLSYWVVMESELDDAIGVALGLNALQVLIVCANIPFHGKCQILLTLIDAGFVKDGPKFEKNIKKALSLTSDRNMIAHHAFFPMKGDEFVVEVYAFKAKGKLDLNKVLWTEDDFEKKCDEIHELGKKFQGLKSDLSAKEIKQFLKDDNIAKTKKK